jgi:P27 family predicted phage terminase small subunit
MGRSGPAPTPTALRVLKGDRPYRINRDEPRPRDELPTEPDWLTAGAREEWRRVLPDLVAMGTAKAVDASALAAYCESVALLARLVREVEATGPIVAGRDGDPGPRKNPAVAMVRDASAAVRMWAREFGFTPSARQPLKVEHAIGGGLSAGRLLS